jgi:hypothetical protein
LCTHEQRLACLESDYPFKSYRFATSIGEKKYGDFWSVASVASAAPPLASGGGSNVDAMLFVWSFFVTIGDKYTLSVLYFWRGDVGGGRRPRRYDI